METWAMEELAGAKLGDGRLNDRLIKLAARFADKPTASIPGACPDWAETQAVYRFFDQASDSKRSLGWQAILDPHIARTEARMRQHPVVLCLQDSTELDFNGQGIDGLGPLSYEAQRGMYLLRPMSSRRSANSWALPMHGCGHANPKRLTARVREFAKACAGRKDTSALPKWRRLCRAPGSCTWLTVKPISSN